MKRKRKRKVDSKLERLVKGLEDLQPELPLDDKSLIRSELNKKISDYLDDQSDKRKRL